ncbi:MAG: FHA domain-containing protein [Chitinivibrionales bacterium]|nr:FHA domain-containing protein [Chitinivibrionales bacterium]
MRQTKKNTGVANETGSASEYVFSLDGSSITIGRDSSCNITVLGVGISRIHARIHLQKPVPVIEDSGSSFGIMLNNQKVRKGGLNDGDLLSMGIAAFAVHRSGKQLVLRPVRLSPSTEQRIREQAPRDQIQIGRDSSNDIQINHPLVSRLHARAVRDVTGAYILTDLNSSNGTFVNGNPVQNIGLRNNDIIQIGPYRYFFLDGRFVQAEDCNRVKLEATGVCVRSRKAFLLDSVSFEINPGEFVAILGPSGAGKTTLSQALTGQIRLSSGAVYYNGLPLKRFFKAFSTSVGYVAQENLLHRELTVQETFNEQSVLRLPQDSSEVERLQRINEVMDLLGLHHAADRRISRLSGGEAKRVHIGIELLSSPTLLFLDEPLAGLDPGLIKRFMHLFKKISERGHTLIITTHVLEQLEQCDRIIFLQSGSLRFNGSAREIKEELGVESIAQVYELTKGELDHRGLQHTKRLPNKSRSVDQQIQAQDIKRLTLFRPKSASFSRQLSILFSRYSRILIRDTRNLLLLLLQPVLIAGLLALVFARDMNFLPLSFYFCITISSIWFGGMNSVREIAGEWLCFEREYRVGLSTAAYILSKLIVFGFLAIVQAMLFGACLFLVFVNIDRSPATMLLLMAGSFGGVLFGLCISAFSGNVRRAISWLPIVLIPQIFFSGILIPFDRMTVWGRVLSYCTASRPVFSLLKRTCFLDQSLWSLTQWQSLVCLYTGLIILMSAALWWRRNYTSSP